jgi:acetyltransferase-like isoleucine patch superfamily enzyme
MAFKNVARTTTRKEAMRGAAINILKFIVVLLPWPIRRRALTLFFGYRIERTARIGLAWIFPRRLELAAGSSIGHLTVCRGIDLVRLEERAMIGRLNWITGFPTGESRHFADVPNRLPELRLGEHAAVTHRHLIDCTHSVTIGAFSTVAGFRSQILSHSIDIDRGRQDAQPIQIGNYCFLGTDCVVLGGSTLPDYSVLAAKSLLNKSLPNTYTLYGGVPATSLKALSQDARYFTRTTGFVE